MSTGGPLLFLLLCHARFARNRAKVTPDLFSDPPTPFPIVSPILTLIYLCQPDSLPSQGYVATAENPSQGVFHNN